MITAQWCVPARLPMVIMQPWCHTVYLLRPYFFYLAFSLCGCVACIVCSKCLCVCVCVHVCV